MGPGPWTRKRRDPLGPRPQGPGETAQLWGPGPWALGAQVTWPRPQDHATNGTETIWTQDHFGPGPFKLGTRIGTEQGPGPAGEGPGPGPGPGV